MTGTGALTQQRRLRRSRRARRGHLAGNAIGVSKSAATLAVLTGMNSYTGRTTVAGGVLELGPSAGCVLNVGGADIQSGRWSSTMPAAGIRWRRLAGCCNASCDDGLWDVGQFQDSTALATGLTLGVFDATLSSQVKVMATYAGDLSGRRGGQRRSGDLVCERLHGHDLAAGRREP